MIRQDKPLVKHITHINMHTRTVRWGNKNFALHQRTAVKHRTNYVPRRKLTGGRRYSQGPAPGTLDFGSGGTEELTHEIRRK